MERHMGFLLGISLAVTISLWGFFYLNYSTNGLPLGWDTPYYVWKIETAIRAATDFVAAEGYYHILYPIAGTWVSAIGLSAFSVELILPLLLWIIGAFLVQAIVFRELADFKAAIFALGAGSTWFAFFRLSSDLHANLMAFVLMLGGTIQFLHLPRELNLPRFAIGSIVLGAVVLVSSFSHVETTLFISAIWLLTLPISLWRGWAGARRSLLLATPILVALVPSAFIYVNQLRLTTGPLEGRLPTVPTMSPIIWLGYFGPVGAAVLVAIPVAYKSNLAALLSNRFGALCMCWLALSLAIGLAQYAYPSLTPFSERAIIMTPTPFLAAMLLPRIRNLSLTSVKGVAIISMIMIGGTGVYYVGIGHVYYDSFISHSASLSLQQLRSQNLIDPTRSIFVFYENASNGGGFAEHDNFWTAAYIGDHYAYFGRLDFLMAGIETPFTDDRSELISRRFLSALPLDKISGMNLIYLEEFNIPNPAPAYYHTFLRPLVNGAYLVDQAGWKTPGDVFVPAYSSVLSTSQGWRSELQDWAYTGRTLKFDSDSPKHLANATIALAIPESGDYRISLRVWDTVTPANPVSIFLDGRQTNQFNYNGTFTPVSLTVFSGNLERGVHYLSLAIQNQTGLAQYLSLDYVSITRYRGASPTPG